MGRGLKVGIAFTGVVIAISIYIAYQINKPPRRLPYFGPQADGAEQHVIGSFSLINQLGQVITEENMNGKICVADFFFTTCHGICPRMTEQMQRVYEHYKGNENIIFLSHTVNPAFDSVPVLAIYAAKLHADARKWHFLTGDKSHIYELARKDYLVSATEGKGSEEDFIHTQNFTLVDKHRHIRGYYDGTDSMDVNKLIEDIGDLLKEN